MSAREEINFLRVVWMWLKGEGYMRAESGSVQYDELKWHQLDSENKK